MVVGQWVRQLIMLVKNLLQKLLSLRKLILAKKNIKRGWIPKNDFVYSHVIKKIKVMIRKKAINKKRPIIIDTTGPDGNAFVLLGYAKSFANQLDLPFDKIQDEMTSGDYENLIQVFDKYFGSFVILER
jgi:hypothetical protein